MALTSSSKLFEGPKPEEALTSSFKLSNPALTSSHNTEAMMSFLDPFSEPSRCNLQNITKVIP